MTLLEETYTLLDASPDSLREIARASGTNFHWLGKFKQRKHQNPGIRNVELLHRHLRERASERLLDTL